VELPSFKVNEIFCVGVRIRQSLWAACYSSIDKRSACSVAVDQYRTSILLEGELCGLDNLNHTGYHEAHKTVDRRFAGVLVCGVSVYSRSQGRLAKRCAGSLAIALPVGSNAGLCPGTATRYRATRWLIGSISSLQRTNISSPFPNNSRQVTTRRGRSPRLRWVGPVRRSLHKSEHVLSEKIPATQSRTRAS